MILKNSSSKKFNYKVKANNIVEEWEGTIYGKSEKKLNLPEDYTYYIVVSALG